MPLAVAPEAVSTIRDLCSLLQGAVRPLNPPELLELTSRLQLDRADWQSQLALDPRQFCVRNLFESPLFEINLIGWHSGQHSTAHDHRGTACCVLVLTGVLTNRDYRLDSTRQLAKTGRFELGPGQILSRSDDAIHRCGNEQPDGADLATLHLYSPPLRPLCERRYG